VSAHHFFTPDVGGDSIRIVGEDARHAVRVLRIRPGESITAADGSGTVVRARCARAESSELIADVEQRWFVDEPAPRVIVYPAIPKTGKLEMVAQKLTEIGVDEIRPWAGERSVGRWVGERARTRTERLRAIAFEASKQSRRARLPVVAPPGPLESLPEPTFAFELDAPQRFGEVAPAVAPAAVGVVIGPEGGLGPKDLEVLSGQGAQVVSMGSQVLRTETAALVAATLVLSHFHRLG
jgi:16S rRNA (uracil1498-N3)-methyltransferase